MKNLKELFEVRDATFEQQTHEIFNKIHTTLVCVTEFLNEIDPLFAQGIITWEDANLVDDMVVVVGILSYELGSKINVEDDIIEITKDNFEYFQRIVNMSLPYNLVESGNAKDIREFLHMIHSNENDEDIISETKEQFKFEENDFDLSKLTEEQRKTYMLYSNNKSKN